VVRFTGAAVQDLFFLEIAIFREILPREFNIRILRGLMFRPDILRRCFVGEIIWFSEEGFKSCLEVLAMPTGDGMASPVSMRVDFPSI